MSDSLKLPGDPSLPPGVSVADIEARFGDSDMVTCPRCHGDCKEPREERYYDLVLRWRRERLSKLPFKNAKDCANELEAALQSKDEACNECGGTGEVASEGEA